MALLIAHLPRLDIIHDRPSKVLVSAYMQLQRFLHLRLIYTLSLLLQRALKQALAGINILLLGDTRKREDWAYACLILCLICFGVETMQIDAYLRAPSERPGTLDEFIRGDALSYLAELFYASTGGSILFGWTGR